MIIVRIREIENLTRPYPIKKNISKALPRVFQAAAMAAAATATAAAMAVAAAVEASRRRCHPRQWIRP